MKAPKNPLPPAKNPAAWPGISRLKDLSIFIGWIGGLLLIGGLCWFLSRPLRSHLLMQAVNKVLIQADDPRRLTAPVPLPELKPGALRIGAWYVMDFSGEGSRAVVFTFIAEGNFFPCLAEINREGMVEKIMPLSRHGESIFRRLSPGSIRIYKRRIEGIEGENL
ncbi:MAG: hypothetical protein LBQ67_04660 [Treponema sp.]|jgi:hypothetical protein|nr:hypothetical protein [Treponema sp.]